MPVGTLGNKPGSVSIPAVERKQRFQSLARCQMEPTEHVEHAVALEIVAALMRHRNKNLRSDRASSPTPCRYIIASPFTPGESEDTTRKLVEPRKHSIHR